ncbi:hypothetical protein D3C85_1179050 [compost metagenome]
MPRPFDHVHQGAEHGDQGAHAEQEDDDLLPAAAQGHQQEVGLGQVLGQLEHAEHPQHADHADDDQVLGIGKDQREDAGKHGEQVDQAVETEGVTQRFRRAVQAGQVLDGEQGGKEPFQHAEQLAVVAVDRSHAVQHHHRQTGEDGQQQEFVEATSGGRVDLEDDAVQMLAQRRRGHGGVPGQGANGRPESVPGCVPAQAQDMTVADSALVRFRPTRCR